MSRIHLLPDTLVSQIAAGEVVERPASVVKELVENSLDAGADGIRIELESGGKRRIRVIDDGVGMGKDDALLAFDRHATSKIRDFDDLQRVGTLGFRGEALSSIAAVSRVELITAEEAGTGWRVRIEGGIVRAVEPAGRARGTTLDIASLFWNVPARRKFLKRSQTELRRAVEVVQGYCLACPEIHFELRHDGRLVLEAPGASDDMGGRQERIRQIFGAELADDLVPLPILERGGERIEGFVGGPGTTKGRRLFVFVNDRLLRDRQILASFYRTVREEWKQDDFPALFLFLTVPPEEVDVNVHPQKAEVRFRDSGFVHRVRESLRGGLVRARREAGAPLRSPRPDVSRPLAWSGLGAGEGGPAPHGHGGEVREPAVPTDSGEGFSVERSAVEGVPFGSPWISAPRHQPGATVRVPLSGKGEDVSIRILGQYKGALLLLEAADALLLLDQHAAHERILYEKLSRSFSAQDSETQRLLVPRLLSLSTAESMTLGELLPGLRELGFVIESLSGNDFALSGVPATLEDDEAVELIASLAGGDADATDVESIKNKLLDELAAERACKGAIKIHQRLSLPQMEELVESLFSCDDPYACPHGRPTLLEMTDADLERRFGRRG